MKHRQLFLLTFCCLIIYSTNTQARSIATYNDGLDAVTDLDKAKIVDYEFVMTGSDYILGAIELRKGLIFGGYHAGPSNSQIGISLPIHDHLKFRKLVNTPQAIIVSNVHFEGDTDDFLIDLTESYGYFSAELFDGRTIYLDSDVTVSGPAGNYFAFTGILDGQGHTIDFSNSLYGGFFPYGACTFKNVTLKNVWYEADEPILGDFSGRGNFLSIQPSTITFDNVSIIARKGKSFLFGLLDFGTPLNVIIKNNVRLINSGESGEFIVQQTYFADDAIPSNFIISSNSSLSIENATLSFRSPFVYSGFTTYRPLNLISESSSAQIVLDNGIIEADARNLGNESGMYAFDTTLTLSVGTLVVKGNSSLIASSLLTRNGRGSIRLGNGVNASGDINIIVNPGATLNLVATNTNCSVKLQNVH